MCGFMQKILAIRNDRFGEFLLNVPALRAIKETYPQAQLHVLVSPLVEELAWAIGFIDKVLVRPPSRHSLWEDMRFALKIRQERYDAAVVLNPSTESHRMIFLAGIPHRVGYVGKQHFFLTDKIENKNNLGLRHEVENNLDLVRLLPATTADKTLSLQVSPGLADKLRARFGLDSQDRLIAVHPYTSDPVKQWVLERFEVLISRLGQERGVRVLVVGKPEPWHREFSLGSTRIIDLRGQTTLIELAAILQMCTCLVSCDSGPVHLAASVGTPVVAVFRNDMPGKSPERWGPWGRGHAVVQASSLEAISVEDVLARVRDCLA